MTLLVDINKKFRLKTQKSQKGSIMILSAFVIILIISITALAVDVSYLYLVKQELQNAADSAALRGGGMIYKVKTGSTYTNATTATPNFTLAEAEARLAAQSNLVEGSYVSNSQVTINTGFWENNVCNSTSSTSQTSYPCIQVTVEKTDVRQFFARFFGITEQSLNATAIVYAYGVGGVGPGTIQVPYAVQECIFSDTTKDIWTVDDRYGQAAACFGGGWATTSTDQNGTTLGTDASSLTGVIDKTYVLPVTVSNSSTINVGSGAVASVYAALSDAVLGSTQGGRVIPPTLSNPLILPVVRDVSAGAKTVVGYACIKFISSNQATKIITFQKAYTCVAANAIPGPYVGTGVVTPPKISF